MEDGFDERDDGGTNNVPISLKEDRMEAVKAWRHIGFKGEDDLLNLQVSYVSIQGELDVI